MIELFWVAFIGCVLGGLATGLREIGPKRIQPAIYIGMAGALFGLFIAFLVKVQLVSVWSLVILPVLCASSFLAIYWLFLRLTASSSVETPKPVQQKIVSTSASDIFLSYASPDRDAAKAFAKALEEEGWTVWWDRTIPPGQSFDEVIETALNSAKCVMVLWSSNSVTSDWVKNEAREAMRRRILIPATIAEVTIPFEFRHIQAADLTGWPSPNHAGFQSLVASVSAIVGAPNPPRVLPPASLERFTAIRYAAAPFFNSPTRLPLPIS